MNIMGDLKKKITLMVFVLSSVLILSGISQSAYGQSTPSGGPPSEPQLGIQSITPGVNVDIFNPGPTDAWCGVGPAILGAPQMQTFTPTATNIAAIEIELLTLNLVSVSPVTINVYEGVGTGGPFLGSTSNDDGNFGPITPDVLGLESVVRFSFASPITVTPGILHTIEVTVNDGASDFTMTATFADNVPNGLILSWRLGELFPNNDYTFATYFDVPIGGISILIDQSALLLAGVQSVSMWMIPVILAGIGIGVFVIKRRN